MSDTGKDNYEVAHPHVAFNPMSATPGVYGLSSMVGGLQNLNGGIYAPGLPSDLAASVGVPVVDAQRAQSLVEQWTPTRPLDIRNDGGRYAHHGGMHACGAPACDERFVAQDATTLHRRSIAFNYTGDVTVNTAVAFVTDTFIQLQNGTSLFLHGNDKVILAAGALSSPQLLNRTSFCGYNHYFDVTVGSSNIVTKQVLDYAVPGYEHNYALMDGVGELKINMEMVPSEKECHAVGANYSRSYAPTKTQAWHFMGTISHKRLRVDGFQRVYTGDAAALLLPFNCHTSAPASAAGVLAVDAALGFLGELEPKPQLTAAVELYSALFAAAGIAAALGVMCHIAGGPKTDNVVFGKVNAHRFIGYILILIMAGITTTALVIQDLRGLRGYSTPVVALSAALLWMVVPFSWFFRGMGYGGEKPDKWLGYAHYALMAAASVLVFVAVALASRHTFAGTSFMKKAQKPETEFHYYAGYVAVALLAIQVLGGVAIKGKAKYQKVKIAPAVEEELLLFN